MRVQITDGTPETRKAFTESFNAGKLQWKVENYCLTADGQMSIELVEAGNDQATTKDSDSFNRVAKELRALRAAVGSLSTENSLPLWDKGDLRKVVFHKQLICDKRKRFYPPGAPWLPEAPYLPTPVVELFEELGELKTGTEYTFEISFYPPEDTGYIPLTTTICYRREKWDAMWNYGKTVIDDTWALPKVTAWFSEDCGEDLARFLSNSGFKHWLDRPFKVWIRLTEVV